jgi:hypothetical protein
MNRTGTVVFAALEAALVVAVGIGVPLLVLTIMWAVQFGFSTDWTIFWRAAVDTWLLGHGVDLQVTLDPELATSLAVSAADRTFAVTIAPLGIAIVTVVLAMRTGMRVGATRFRELGAVAALATVLGLSWLATVSAVDDFAQPSLAQGIILPTLVFALGLAIGLVRTPRPDGDTTGSSVRDWVADWPDTVRAGVAASLRGGAAAATIVIGASAVLVSLLLAINYATVISLYESLHAGVSGGTVLTMAQLSAIPNATVWTASWLVGPGFSIGAGSNVSALATHLGPIPAVPMLGALPTGELGFGFLGLLVPIVAGFLVGAVGATRIPAGERVPSVLLGSALGSGAVAGILLGLLSWFSAGAAGPGRLVEVGPNPFTVALFATLEVGIAAVLGQLAASRRRPLA